MDEKTLRLLLLETASGVLENAAYVMIEPYEASERPAENGGKTEGPVDTVKASIFFTGSVSGLLTMTVPHSLAVTISANMLGQEGDSEESAAKSADAVGEILNVICGMILPHLQGSPAGYAMGTPAISRQESHVIDPLPAESPFQPVGGSSDEQRFAKAVTCPMVIEDEIAVIELFFTPSGQGLPNLPQLCTLEK